MGITSCAARHCPPLPAESTRCHCSGCHQTFSGISAFENHQTFPDGGSLTCHDPATRGLVFRKIRGALAWGWPERGDAVDWAAIRRRSVSIS